MADLIIILISLLPILDYFAHSAKASPVPSVYTMEGDDDPALIPWTMLLSSHIPENATSEEFFRMREIQAESECSDFHRIREICGLPWPTKENGFDNNFIYWLQPGIFDCMRRRRERSLYADFCIKRYAEGHSLPKEGDLEKQRYLVFGEYLYAAWYDGPIEKGHSSVYDIDMWFPSAVEIVYRLNSTNSSSQNTFKDQKICLFPHTINKTAIAHGDLVKPTTTLLPTATHTPDLSPLSEDYEGKCNYFINRTTQCGLQWPSEENGFDRNLLYWLDPEIINCVCSPQNVDNILEPCAKHHQSKDVYVNDNVQAQNDFLLFGYHFCSRWRKENFPPPPHHEALSYAGPYEDPYKSLYVDPNVYISPPSSDLWYPLVKLIVKNYEYYLEQSNETYSKYGSEICFSH